MLLTKNYYFGNFCSAFPLLCSFSFSSLPKAIYLLLNAFIKGAKIPSPGGIEAFLGGEVTL